jgi:MFS transporter, ACS family, hexuronate transporter
VTQPAPSLAAVPQPAPYSAADRWRWFALALVFGAALLNYIDRQAIAILKPVLEERFDWSDSDYAHIVSAFQLATIFSLLAVGWFVDRVGVRIGYAVGVGGWSLAQMAHALAASLTGFVVVRVILAVTEAINLPAAVKTVATWFRGDDRSLALGVMNLAPNIGAVAAPLLVPVLAVAFGWQAAFIITGALGIIWLAGWLMLPRPAGPAPAPPTGPAAPPPAGEGLRANLGLLRDRRTWAIALGKFLSDFVWVFLFFWAPDIFSKQYGLSMSGASWPVATVFLMAGAGSFFAGWTSSRMLAAGRSYNLSRKAPMALAAILAIPVFTVSAVDNVWLAAVLLGLTLAAHQMFSTSMFGLATDVISARRVGLVIGFGATIGSMSGLLMNEFTGATLDATGSYAPMLALCAAGKIIALIVVHLLVPDIDRTRRKMLETDA